MVLCVTAMAGPGRSPGRWGSQDHQSMLGGHLGRCFCLGSPCGSGDRPGTARNALSSGRGPEGRRKLRASRDRALHLASWLRAPSYKASCEVRVLMLPASEKKIFTPHPSRPAILNGIRRVIANQQQVLQRNLEQEQQQRQQAPATPLLPPASARPRLTPPCCPSPQMG